MVQLKIWIDGVERHFTSIPESAQEIISVAELKLVATDFGDFVPNSDDEAEAEILAHFPALSRF